MQPEDVCVGVRYTLSGEPALSGLCHCRNCQRYTGSAFEPVMVFPSTNFSVQGELKTYEDKGDSGKAVLRRFCPNCGSGISAEAEAMPRLAIVLVGGFDDPSVFTPTMEIFCNSAQPWVHAGGERKQFPKMPG